MLFPVISILIFTWVNEASAHGRLLEPPNRSTLWRVAESDIAVIPYKDIVEPNWTDNELFCGGFQHQKNLGGKCGLCGDPWDGVRENEAGGKYGKGIIVRQYAQGSVMDATVELTAHHIGYFEFRLCAWNNPTVPGTHECLNQHLLTFADGFTKYYPDKTSSGKTWIFNMRLLLPSDVTCDQCILQWKYHTENSWDCDEDGNCCTGCGPQEEFYGCADIAIGNGPTLPPPGWNEPTAVETTPIKATTTLATTSTSQSTTTTTTTAVTTTTEATTAIPQPTTEIPTNEPPAPPSGELTCDGRVSGEYMADCDTFYTCSANGAGPYIYNCPPGTVYDELRQICDYPSVVPPPCGTKQ